MAALAVLGAADAVSVVIRMTLVQIETPDEMRGRVNAVNSLFAGTSNQLGDFRAGVMAAWLGAIPAVLVGGVGTLLVVLIWTRSFPALRRVDSFYVKKPVMHAGASGLRAGSLSSAAGRLALLAASGLPSQWLRKAASQARPAGS